MVVHLNTNRADEVIACTFGLKSDSVGYAQLWYCLTHDVFGYPSLIRTLQTQSPGLWHLVLLEPPECESDDTLEGIFASPRDSWIERRQLYVRSQDSLHEDPLEHLSAAPVYLIRENVVPISSYLRESPKTEEMQIPPDTYEGWLRTQHVHYPASVPEGKLAKDSY